MQHKNIFAAMVALALCAGYAWSIPPQYLAKVAPAEPSVPALYEYQPPLQNATLWPKAGNAPMFMAASAAVPDTIDALWGGYVNSSTATYTGMWNIPVKPQSKMMLQVGDNNLYPNAGGVLIGNYYFSFKYTGNLTKDTRVTLQGYNTNGNFQPNSWWSYDYGYTSRPVSWVAIDMAYNPADTAVYGCFYNDSLDGFQLAKVKGLEYYNSSNATRTTIADLEMPLCAMGFADNGMLYGLTFFGELVKVDTSDGKYTLIGDTGIDPYYYTGGTVANGKFYYLWSSDAGKTAVYEIDLATAAAKKVAEVEGIQILKGLFMKSSLVKKGPKMPANTRTVFEGISTAGKVIFDVPELTQSEEAGQGNLKYRITEGDELLDSGTVAYGQKDVTADIDVKTLGYHYLKITLEDAEGIVSPEATVSLSIGYSDYPDQVQNVLAYYDNGKFYVKWDRVTTGDNGAKPLDASKVKYRARLFQGNTQVPYVSTYTGTDTCCQLSYKVNANKAAKYVIRVDVSITGKFNKWGYATSNNVLTGGADLPYSETFTRYDCLDNLCVWDNNGDGKTFTWFSNAGGEARMQANWDNRDMAEDDWLIFKGVKLEAGIYYEFSMDYYTIIDQPERFGVWMGKEANPHALTTPVIAEEVRNHYDRTTISGGFVAKEAGTYFFGLHACSDPDSYWLTVDNVKVAKGAAGDAPQAPSQLTIEPDKSGVLYAKVSCAAPFFLLNGEKNRYNKYEKIEIYRGSQLAYTQSNVMPGSVVTFEDQVPSDGYYTYKAIAYNASGAGLAAEATGFVGVNKPVSPAGVSASESATKPGEVTLEWEAVTRDIDGHIIDPRNVTYSIANYEADTTYLTGVKGTKATFQATEEGEQRFDLFTVLASTRTGNAETLGYAQLMPVGKPDAMPYFLSFEAADTINQHIFTTMAFSGGAKIQYGTTGTDFAADGNGNGVFLIYSGDTQSDYIDLITGKIHIDAKAKNPRLVYYLLNIAADDENQVGILINGEVAQKVALKTLPVGRWSRLTVDLAPYKGKDISIRARGVIANYAFTFFDGIEVVDMPEHDLAIIGVDAPAKVDPNYEFKVATTLRNLGSKDANGATMQIFRNDSLLVETDSFNVAAGDLMRVNLPQTLTLLDADTAAYAMQLQWEADEVGTNNALSGAVVALNLPDYPTVTLAGEADENQNAVLSWAEPATMPAPADSLTDDFEAYVPFTFGNVGKWTMVDGDKSPVGELTFSVPGMTPGVTCTSFVHFDLTQIPGFGYEGFDNCSGYGFIASIFTENLERRDDWAISPLLSGKAQTVKFKARSMGGNESFQVLYSTTEAVPDSFALLKQEVIVPNQWKEYAYELPEGALYFAIRDNSNHADVLYVDDFTYAPGQRSEIIGYNVYRDGVLLTAEPIDSLGFVDPYDRQAGKHTYAVTVVYGEGESAASNVVSIVTMSLGSIDASAASVMVEEQSIVVANVVDEPVVVATADGRVVYNAVGTGRNVARVQPGIYVVKAGSLVKKVLVI